MSWLNDPRNAAILAEWNAGNSSSRVIGARYGLSGARVCQILNKAEKAGAEVRREREVRKGRSFSHAASKSGAAKSAALRLARTAEIRTQVERLRLAGTPPSVIARELGITPGRVHGFLSRMGLTNLPEDIAPPVPRRGVPSEEAERATAEAKDAEFVRLVLAEAYRLGLVRKEAA